MLELLGDTRSSLPIAQGPAASHAEWMKDANVNAENLQARMQSSDSTTYIDNRMHFNMVDQIA
jgi:hypothetical protein